MQVMDARARSQHLRAVMHQTGLVLRQGKVRNDLTAMTKQEMPEKTGQVTGNTIKSGFAYVFSVIPLTQYEPHLLCTF